MAQSRGATVTTRAVVVSQISDRRAVDFHTSLSGRVANVVAHR
ncbi:MAG: hypothetical protein ACRD0K_20855 [Egibacteraceae bacterium]